MPIVEASPTFKGYVSDVNRDALPADVASRMVDWIPNLDARLRRRGGWTYSSPDVASITAGPTKIAAVVWAPFSGRRINTHVVNDVLVIVGNDGSVYVDRTFDGVNADYAGYWAPAGQNLTARPFWSNDLSGVIFPVSRSHPNGQTVGKLYSQPPGGVLTAAVLAGSPPAAITGCSWGDYVLLANGDSATIYAGPNFTNRIWISGVGTPETWTPGTDFWDSVISNIVALAPTRAGILVFGFSQTSLISGDTPPAGGNWSETIVFGDQGCMDERTLASYEDVVFFANNTGVYSTDGVNLTDLTLASGVKLRWQELVGQFNYSSGWQAAGGVYRNYYVVTVHDNNGNFITCHVFDFLNHTAFEFTNVRASMFAHVSHDIGGATFPGQERLFMAPINSTRVEDLGQCWVSPNVPATDGDGATILPQLETPLYKLGGPVKKMFRSMRATYDVRQGAGDPPSLAVDYCLPGGSYRNIGSLPATTAEDRQRVDIRDRGSAVGLRLTQVNPSYGTTLSDIELDLWALEGMR